MGAAAAAAPRFSNGVVAAVLAVPLMLGGIFSARAVAAANEDSWRPDGLLHPPVNPFLREDMLPRYHHRRDNKQQQHHHHMHQQQMQQQQQQQQQEQQRREGGAGRAP